MDDYVSLYHIVMASRRYMSVIAGPKHGRALISVLTPELSLRLLAQRILVSAQFATWFWPAFPQSNQFACNTVCCRCRLCHIFDFSYAENHSIRQVTRSGHRSDILVNRGVRTCQAEAPLSCCLVFSRRLFNDDVAISTPSKQA